MLKLQQNVLRKIDEATLLLKKFEQVNALKTASKHITSAVIALKSIRDPCVRTILPMKRIIAPNTNSEKQRRFFSTKKKGKGTRLKITKPSRQEINQSRMNLMKQAITHCGICYKENDESTEEYVNWIQCLSCDIWVHEKCARGTFNNDRCTACHSKSY